MVSRFLYLSGNVIGPFSGIYKSGGNPDAFIFVVNTTSPSQDFRLPLQSSGTYNFTVNWGDNSSDTITVWNQAERTHTYTDAGTYIITCVGTLSYFSISNDAYDLLTTKVTQWGNTGITTMHQAFHGCNNLTEIPAGAPSGPGIATYYRAFAQTGLVTIPAGLFSGSFPALTNLSECFYNCDSLAEIPAGLLDNLVAVTSVEELFYSCGLITSIPAGLFDNMTSITNFRQVFTGCPITSIPDGLLDYCVNITDIYNSFNGTSISSIPSGFLDNLTALTNVSTAFRDTNITSVDPLLFQYNTLLTSVAAIFESCDSLTAIPSGLFDNNVNITNFREVFFGCDLITSIPTGLFDNNTAATDFYRCFSNCQITSIPTGLFDNCPNVNTTFTETFKSCALTAIPAGLFDSCVNAVGLNDTFASNNITAIPAGLLDYMTNATTFYEAFYSNPITAIPSGLLDNNPLVTQMYRTFGATDITAIPAGLFDAFTGNVGFTETFISCNLLTATPSGLFDMVGGGAVTSLNSTFEGCTSLTAISDAGNWNMTQCTTCADLFRSSTINTTDYDAMWVGWDAQVLKNNVPFHGGSSAATGAGLTARNNIISTYGWTVTDAS